MVCQRDSPHSLLCSSCYSVQIFAVQLTSDSRSLTVMAPERCAFGSFPILTPSKFLRTGHYIPSIICTPRRKVCFRFPLVILTLQSFVLLAERYAFGSLIILPLAILLRTIRSFTGILRNQDFNGT